MRISELSKKQRVRVRVPAKLLKELGGRSTRLGIVRSIQKLGSVTRVYVKLNGRGGVHGFRPHDLTVA